MGKVLVVIGTTLAFIASVVIFMMQPSGSKQAEVAASVSGEPRVVVDDFAVYRYKGHNLVSTMSAKLGHFVEPNVVEVFASIRAVRFKDNFEESLRCEAAHAQFEAEHMRDLLKDKDTQITYAEVEDQVRLGVKEDILRTEHAQYYGDRSILLSREPVQVDGPNRTFVGEQGFTYNIPNQVLELSGKVRGVVQPRQEQ